MLQLGGATILNTANLPTVLQLCYPQHNWNLRRFASGGKSQDFLLSKVCNLWSDREILRNYKHPELVYEDSMKNMELDIFIPSLSLAFEFQGFYHFQFYYFSGNSEHMQQRDHSKRVACDKIGVTLINVPYTWDSTTERYSYIHVFHC